MKQFSVSCNERSIILDYLNEANKMTQTTFTFTNIPDKYTFSDISWLAVFFTIVLDAILLLGTVRLAPELGFFWGAVMFAFIGSLKFVNAVEKFIYLNFTPEGRKISRIHSAMHQAINAMILEDTLNPTLDKMRVSSRFSNSCETVYTTESILLGFLSIPIVMFTYHHLALCFILLILLRVLVENLLDHGLLNFLQILYLRKPTDDEINFVYQIISKREQLLNLLQQKQSQSSKKL